MNIIRKRQFLLGVLLSTCAVAAANAFETVGSVEDSILRGLRGGLRAIELPINVGRERAEDLYTYNHGANLEDALNLGTNEYIAEFKICEEYWLKVSFTGAVDDASSRWDSEEISGTTEVPLPAEILGKTIFFVPVLNANDYKITTWECVTNFNLDQSIFKGDTGAGVRPGVGLLDTETAVRSTLTKYTTDPIMQKCVYAYGEQWTNISTTPNCDIQE